MSLMPLFPSENDAPAQASRLAPKLRALASEGIYFGTSSWKYEGWLGSIYSPERYQTRGKFSRKRFEAECLKEYAETFPVVCGDFAFYQFPSHEYWNKLFRESPEMLQFAFKVPEDITVSSWPRHARYGTRAGEPNAGFLDVKMFEHLFTRPLEPYRSRVATLIFEFGTFNRSTFPTPDHFLERLDPFLEALPGGFRYAIEIRNSEYLGPGYLSLLSSHGVAHVLNAWTRMPELTTQLDTPGIFTADFTVVRALLSKDRPYEKAVAALQPYDQVKEPDEKARKAMTQIADRSRKTRRPAFLFINNRLEGNAPTTIETVVGRLGL